MASRIVRQLSQMGREPRSALRELGLNERQRAQFNQADQHLATNLRWLELPAHRMLNYGAAGCPEPFGPDRRCAAVFADRGDPQALLRPQLAVVGSRQFSHYERWANYFAANWRVAVSPSPAVWRSASTAFAIAQHSGRRLHEAVGQQVVMFTHAGTAGSRSRLSSGRAR
ncbi:hypothetical protein M8494_29750 [Serratia ureilytica]